MAEPIQSYIFGGNTGLTEAGLKHRRDIAARLAAKRMKLPTTIGEGMTYFGESVNEAIQMRRLAEQENQFAEREAEQMRQLGLDPPATAPPSNARAAAPPPMQLANASLATDPSVGTPPDTPVPDGVNVFDTPTGAGEGQPLPPNPPIVNREIRPSPPAGVPGPLDRAPPYVQPQSSTPPLDPRLSRPLPEPAAPTMPAMNEKERRGWLLERFGTSDKVRQGGAALRAIGAQERMDAHQREVEAYKLKYGTSEKSTLQHAGEQFGTGLLQRQEAERKASQDREDIARFGRVGGGKIFEDRILSNADKQKPIIEDTAVTITKLKSLLDNPIYSGPTAPPRMMLDKALEFIGHPAPQKLSDTQAYQALVSQLYGPLRAAVIGPGAQTNIEGQRLDRAAAGDISLDPRAIRTVIDSIERQNYRAAQRYQQPIATYTGSVPDEKADPEGASRARARQQHWYGQAGIDWSAIVSKAQIEALRRAGELDPSEYDKFDAAHHTPGLARRLLGVR